MYLRPKEQNYLGKFCHMILQIHARTYRSHGQFQPFFLWIILHLEKAPEVQRAFESLNVEISFHNSIPEDKQHI